MDTPPWPEGHSSIGAEGFAIEGFEGVLKGVAITMEEDCSIGSILHSRVCSPVKPSKITSGLGRGWVIVMMTKASYVQEEFAGGLEELGGVSLVYLCGGLSSGSSSMDSSSSSSKTKLMSIPSFSM